VPGKASPNLSAANVSNGADATLVAVCMAVGLAPLICVRDMVQVADARAYWGGMHGQGVGRGARVCQVNCLQTICAASRSTPSGFTRN
jgi:hypothetical protein